MVVLIQLVGPFQGTSFISEESQLSLPPFRKKIHSFSLSSARGVPLCMDPERTFFYLSFHNCYKEGKAMCDFSLFSNKCLNIKQVWGRPTQKCIHPLVKKYWASAPVSTCSLDISQLWMSLGADQLCSYSVNLVFCLFGPY